MQVKNPGRNLIVQVAAADGTTWLDIAAITTADLNPGENEVAVDTSSYDSVDENGDAYYEEMVTQRGASITITGQYEDDSVTGAQDPGQARIAALSAKTGNDAYGKVRFRRNAQSTTWKVWERATFREAAQGSPHAGVTAWGCVIRRSGPSTTAAVA